MSSGVGDHLPGRSFVGNQVPDGNPEAGCDGAGVISGLGARFVQPGRCHRGLFQRWRFQWMNTSPSAKADTSVGPNQKPEWSSLASVAPKIMNA